MTTATETKHWTIDEIKTANRVRGQHFFDQATLRFFRSRIGATVYQGPGGIYFVTSEQYASMAGPLRPRRYTVRRFDPATGCVQSAGEFMAFATIGPANRRAVGLAKGDQE